MAEFGFNLPEFDFSQAFTDIDASGARKPTIWEKMGQNPEQLAIALDMIGSGFAPENPFAGVGSTLGRSSLAAKALKEQQQGESDFRQLLASMISGRGFSPQGTEGPTKLTMGPGKEGTDEMSLSYSTPRLGKKKEGEYLSLSDLMSGPF